MSGGKNPVARYEGEDLVLLRTSSPNGNARRFGVSNPRARRRIRLTLLG